MLKDLYRNMQLDKFSTIAIFGYNAMNFKHYTYLKGKNYFLCVSQTYI